MGDPVGSRGRGKNGVRLRIITDEVIRLEICREIYGGGAGYPLPTFALILTTYCCYRSKMALGLHFACNLTMPLIRLRRFHRGLPLRSPLSRLFRMTFPDLVSKRCASDCCRWLPVVVSAGLCVLLSVHLKLASADDPALTDAGGRPPATIEKPATAPITTSNSTAAGPTTAEASESSAGEDADHDAASLPIDLIGPGKQPPDSLVPLVEFARKAQLRFETEVDAYTCMLVKRETLEGSLESPKYIQLKIRERRAEGEQLIQPRSLYAKFLKPTDVAGREVLFVEDERDGNILVRRGGTRLPNLTLELKADSRLAKRESNYSILQTGIRPMLEQILDRIETQIDPKNIKIRYFADAKVDGRPCQHIEVNQLAHTPESTFQLAKVYIDNELELPVYFSSYAWSEEPEGEPVLQEQYAITKINLSAKLTDLDFDRTNPEYQFRPEEEDASEEDLKE